MKTAARKADPSSGVSAWMLLILALWLQLFWSCIPAWQHGEYYSYGWYVPPLAILFALRLRHLLDGARAKLPPASLIVAGLVTMFLALTCLRTLQQTDPRWTLPIWLQAALVAGFTFYSLVRLGGPKLARRAVPVVLFAFTAIPLPTVIERLVVSNLTDSVIATTARLLGLLGRPVVAIGDQLGRLGEVVRVTDGCSGIQSGQSFLMAALFFGEWMELKAAGRWMMVAAGLVTAWSLNVARASSLAWIRFERGEGAFEAAHDLAGLLAFLVGSALLLWISSALEPGRNERRVFRRTVERSAA